LQWAAISLIVMVLVFWVIVYELLTELSSKYRGCASESSVLSY
jgi:hypothetical protein